MKKTAAHENVRNHGGALCEEPRRPGRKALGLEVVSQGGQIAPGRVAARELHDARRQHESEEEPHEEEARERGGGQAAPDAPAPRRGEEDRQEARLEQEQVPLELQEELSGHRHREVEEPRQKRGGRGHEPRDEQKRREDAPGAESVERRVPGAEPAERGDQPVALGSSLGSDPVEEGSDRKDPAFADQAVGLDPERDERREVTETEEPQEERVRREERGPQDRSAPEHARRGRGGGTMLRDDPVRELRRRRRARDPAVDPLPGAAAARQGQQARHGLGAREHAPVGKEKLHRLGERLRRNLGEARALLLRGRVIDRRSGALPPARDPRLAESARAVVEHERALGGIRDAHARPWRHRRSLPTPGSCADRRSREATSRGDAFSRGRDGERMASGQDPRKTGLFGFPAPLSSVAEHTAEREPPLHKHRTNGGRE